MLGHRWSWCQRNPPEAQGRPCVSFKTDQMAVTPSGEGPDSVEWRRPFHDLASVCLPTLSFQRFLPRLTPTVSQEKPSHHVSPPLTDAPVNTVPGAAPLAQTGLCRTSQRLPVLKNVTDLSIYLSVICHPYIWSIFGKSVQKKGMMNIKSGW